LNKAPDYYKDEVRPDITIHIGGGIIQIPIEGACIVTIIPITTYQCCTPC